MHSMGGYAWVAAGDSPQSIMENYETEWADKKLIDYGPTPFGHLFRRIVPTSRLIARRDEQP